MGQKCAASHKIWFPHLSPTVSTPSHQTPLVGLAGPLELYALLMNLRGKKCPQRLSAARDRGLLKSKSFHVYAAINRKSLGKWQVMDRLLKLSRGDV